MPGLGRRFAPDPRDSAHPMQALVPPVALPTRKFWTVAGGIHAPALDQGNTGTCVAHGWYNFLRYAPIETAPPFSAYALYREIVTVDEWSDNDLEAMAGDGGLQFGTSVRAGAKVLRAKGHLESYVWAFDLDTMISYLMTRGPVVIGVDWYTGMSRPDRNLYVRPTGSRIGGHCVCVIGADRIQRFAVFANSWGAGWGELGLARISFADLDRLIRANGEVCAAVEKVA